MAVPAQQPCQKDQQENRSDATCEGDRGWMVRCGVEPLERLLRPAIPGDAAADKKRDTGDDEAAFAQQWGFAILRKDQLGGLHRNEYDEDAFEAEHEEEINPVDAPGARVRRVCAGEGQRRQRGLLNQELLGDGERQSEQQEAGGPSPPASRQLAAQQSASAPHHHLGDEHEDEAEPG